ncbi:MAG: site-2 protease family protein, partial [Anaerovoracaceae bacterium]
IGQTSIDQWTDVAKAIAASDKESIDLTLMRDGKEIALTSPLMEQEGRTMIGISPQMEKSIGGALVNGPKATWEMTKNMYSVLKQLFT